MELRNRRTDVYPRSSNVRVTAGALEGLHGEVVTAEADQLMIALDNSPGVYLVVNSGSVAPLAPQLSTDLLP